jgi:ribosome-binding protein aMBF1 (putative translation factor)
MIIRICAFSFVVAITSLPLLAAPQQSLGDIARQLRQQQLKAGLKTTRVYTNDDLPARPPDETRAAASGMSSTPAVSSSDKAQAEPDSSHAATETSKAPETGQAANEPEKPENKKGTKEYWQSRFKSARARLADAEERQHLAEDELNLLQIQDAREIDPTAKAELADKIKAKENEVSGSRAATAEAQKTLLDLENEFKASGAPDEWSETETETRR